MDFRQHSDVTFVPTSPDAQAAFRTHANYIEAFYQVLDGRASENSQTTLSKYTYDRIVRSGLCDGARRVAIDADSLRRALSHAWGIEFLLYANHEAIDDDAVIRVANNWACIQAYYIFYHATQAILVAKGQQRPESHEKTQKAFLNLWTERTSDLVPWSLGFGPEGPCGVPASHPIDPAVQNLAHCDNQNCWSLAAKALKTTRDKKLPECLKSRRKDKRRERARQWDDAEMKRLAAGKKALKKPPGVLPKLTNDEKQEVCDNLRSHSLMDYLYRLRIKANYEDADMFTEGPSDSMQSAVLYRRLCALASATLFLSELSVMPIWGKSELLEFRDSWMKQRSQTITQPELMNRSHLLREHVV